MKKTDGSSSDILLSDGQNLSDQESKFVYATKATRWYQKQEVSLKLQKVGVPPTLVGFQLKGRSRAMWVLALILGLMQSIVWDCFLTVYDRFYGLFVIGTANLGLFGSPDLWGCLWPILGLIYGWFLSLGVTSFVDCVVGITYAT